MSQKETELLERIRRLPERTQERFLDKLDGATMAFDDMPGRAVMMDTGASAGGAGSHGSGGTESR